MILIMKFEGRAQGTSENLNNKYSNIFKIITSPITARLCSTIPAVNDNKHVRRE